MDEEREENDVPGEEGELEGGEGEPGGGDEEEGGEGRIGGRKLPLGDGEPVKIPAARDGGAFGPIDEDIGHGDALRQTESGEADERDGEKRDCGRGRLDAT